MSNTSVEQNTNLCDQIQEDLLGLLEGEVRCDSGTRALYATDASLHQIQPLAVVFPRGTEDVKKVVRYGGDHQIPLIARGAGTGLAGGCLGEGIVVDFSRHMNKILEIRSNSVLVQPGVVLDDLNAALAMTGRYFAPDPSNSAITTIGGMIGVDAAGSHAIRVGSIRDHIQSLQVVFSDGTAHWLQQEPIVAGTTTHVHSTDEDEHDDYARVRVILRRLAALLRENRDLIEKYQPLLLRNCAGYMLRGVLRNGMIDFPRLFAGSEGTLGLCTEVVLQTTPIPAERDVLLVLFSQFDQALQALPSILNFEPAACDLLDRRLLTLSRESSNKYEQIIPASAEAAMIIEFVDTSRDDLSRRTNRFKDFLQIEHSGCSVGIHARGELESAELWKLPQQVVPLLARIQGTARPIPFVEDIVVPPQSLGKFLPQAQRVLQRHRVTASLYAHAGSGQLHLRPFLEMPRQETTTFYESLARDLYRVVAEFGGSISGEHGDGLSRTAFIRTQYGPLYRLFQQIKQLFDPKEILNPNKIVSGDPHLTIQNLRPDGELIHLAVSTRHQLQWSSQQLLESAGLCNGCGQCKAVSNSSRMCPFSRIEKTEYTSPRSKANLLRSYLSTESDPSQEDDFTQLAQLAPAEVLDTCFNCKQCQIDCPSHVDIPHLWLEAKAADVLANGLNRSDWVLSRIATVAALLWRFSWLVNPILHSRPGRWLLEKTVGIDSRRTLPAFARKPFLLQLKGNSENIAESPDTESYSSPEKAPILFIDYFVNYHAPEVAAALTAILEHNHIPYLIPLDQDVSGMSMVSVGDLSTAKEIAENNVRILGPYAREGHRIVCIEPSSALCLSKEYPLLLDHPDLEAISQMTCEAGAYLLEKQTEGLLKTDFKELPGQIGYHEPCHQRILAPQQPFPQLLKMIPGLEVMPIEKGCSGMAGHFGFTKKNYENSIQIGQELMEAVVHENFTMATTECSACKLQMEHNNRKTILHPLLIIAAGYGLIPIPASEISS